MTDPKNQYLVSLQDDISSSEDTRDASRTVCLLAVILSILNLPDWMYEGDRFPIIHIGLAALFGLIWVRAERRLTGLKSSLKTQAILSEDLK